MKMENGNCAAIVRRFQIRRIASGIHVRIAYGARAVGLAVILCSEVFDKNVASLLN